MVFREERYQKRALRYFAYNDCVKKMKLPHSTEDATRSSDNLPSSSCLDRLKPYEIQGEKRLGLVGPLNVKLQDSKQKISKHVFGNAPLEKRKVQNLRNHYLNQQNAFLKFPKSLVSP